MIYERAIFSLSLSAQIIKFALNLQLVKDFVKMEEANNLCSVCFCPPPDSKKHHVFNYGAKTCMGCKIFFKRGQNEKTQAKFKCKLQNPGYCDIHFEIDQKERCKMCRYLKCLDVGMDPAKIKEGHEKEKYTRNNLYCFEESKKKNLMTVILKENEASIKQVQLDRTIMEFLVFGHVEEVQWTFEHTKTFLMAMDLHSQRMLEMTLKLKLYQGICQEDQKLLSQNNLVLLQEYIFARYFFANQTGESQLTWLFGFNPVDIVGNITTKKIQQRSFMEINAYGQIIPSTWLIANDIFSKCFEAIGLHYHFPSYFNPLLGLYILLSVDHWSGDQRSALKESQKVQSLKTVIEDVLLSEWNEKGEDPTMAFGQLDTFIKTLDVMWHVCRYHQDGERKYVINETSSTICSILEHEWTKESHKLWKDAFVTYQITDEIVEWHKDMSQKIFPHLDKRRDSFIQLTATRLQGIVSHFGDLKVDLHALQTICMVWAVKLCCGCPNLKEQISWLMGAASVKNAEDYFEIASMPPVNLLDIFQASGNFVKRKHDQFRFSQLCEELLKMIEDDEVLHLFLMSLLFDNEKSRPLQDQYHYLLVKKLSVNCERYGAETGHHALNILRSYTNDYVEIATRFVEEAFANVDLNK